MPLRWVVGCSTGDAMQTVIKRSEVWRQLSIALSLGLPLVGSNLAQSLTHVTDTIMLGWYGVAELAAVALGATMFAILFIVGSGFAMAAVPLAASAEAAGRPWRARRIIRMAAWLSLLYSAASVPVMWHAEWIFLTFGQPEPVAKLAGDYMRIALFGIFPAMLIMTLKSFFLAVSQARIILWATLIGAAFNLIANYALIFGNFGFPEMGVQGAAVASVLSQTLALVILVVRATTARDLRHYALLRNFWRLERPVLREVFRLGWPISTTLVAETGFFGICAVMMGWLGRDSLAAHGIVIEIASLVFMIYLGLANAGTAMLGRASVRADRASLAAAAGAVLILTGVAASAVITVFLVIPETIIWAFLDRDSADSEQVARIAITLIHVAALFQLADAVQVVALGLLRGLQDTKIPMLFATAGYMLLGIPASYLLGFLLDWGAAGIWVGFIFGLTATATLLLLRFALRLRRVPVATMANDDMS